MKMSLINGVALHMKDIAELQSIITWYMGSHSFTCHVNDTGERAPA